MTNVLRHRGVQTEEPDPAGDYIVQAHQHEGDPQDVAFVFQTTNGSVAAAPDRELEESPREFISPELKD